METLREAKTVSTVNIRVVKLPLVDNHKVSQSSFFKMFSVTVRTNQIVL